MGAITQSLRLRRGIGLTLLVLGLLGGYWWFYRLSPLRRLVDPVWVAAHSESARWLEEQKDYRRAGRSPDLCFVGDRVGFYGNKDWFLWLEGQIRQSKDFRHCGCTEFALTLMANKHVTDWSKWTDENRKRSQETWIKDGFRDYGVTVHLPPSTNDTLPLLRLLGRNSWNFLFSGPQGTNAPDAVPSYVHYNAYRWLRDSGFKPMQFASSNASLSIEPDISKGLLRYCQWQAAYPGDDGLGVLAPTGPRTDFSPFSTRPIIANPWVVTAVNALIAAFGIGGTFLIVRSKHLRKRCAN